MTINDLLRRPSRPTALLDALIDAAHRQDAETLAGLCARHRDEIYRAMPVWRTVPTALDGNPAARDQYCKGLIAVASFFQCSGDSTLLELLTGHEAANPVTLWLGELSRAQALIAERNPAQAIALLRSIIERTSGFSGQAVSSLKPRTLASLGAAYLHMGDKVQAFKFTQQAWQLCREIGDDPAAKACRKILQDIQDSTPSGRSAFPLPAP